jgi:hypothetical protein
VRQDAAGDDRKLFRNGNTEAGEEEDDEQAGIAKLLDERNDQIAPRGKIRFPEDGDQCILR